MELKLTGMKNGTSLTEPEMLEIARLLVKAGYTTRIARKRPTGKTSGPYDKYIVIAGGDTSNAGE